MTELDDEKVEKYSNKLNRLQDEMKKVVYGQSKQVDYIVKCLACDGHALLEGVPGTGKTLTILTMSQLIEGCDSQRIQFTPDLLPSDIVGTMIYREGEGFKVEKGPVFSNIIAADEINRTPPKVQSAMLQAMQEREVSIGRHTYDLPEPFMVAATQNPLETKGVYPLPEAQMDRFLFKINYGYAPREEEKKTIDSNLDVQGFDEYNLEKILNKKDIKEIHNTVPKLKSSEEIKRYIVNIVDATRNPEEYGLSFGNYIQWGGSPRASIYLNVASKANALVKGRNYTTPQDVRDIAIPVLRHRVVLNYEGKAEQVKKKDIINEVLDKAPVV